ncbi:MAG TPA: hypothetical protein VJW20_01300 [Candidatus Angelobacter sp.]|nr:hypothetical protein [Candidatus Angelobacter sp.]
MSGSQPTPPNSSRPAAFINKLAEAYEKLEGIESSLDSIISANSELVEHVSTSWASALTPGFWAKILMIRMKQAARRKLTSKCLRNILSVRSAFVMNVQAVKTWRDSAQSVLVKFNDTEMRELYQTVIALKYDGDFLEALARHNEFLFYYFLDKIPYIERNRDLFEGRTVLGPSEYTILAERFSVYQDQINSSIRAAIQLQPPPTPPVQESAIS